MTTTPIKMEGRALEITKALLEIRQATEAQRAKLATEMQDRWVRYSAGQEAAAGQLNAELGKLLGFDDPSKWEVDTRYLTPFDLAFLVPRAEQDGDG